MTLSDGSLTTPEILPPTEAHAIAVESAMTRQKALKVVRTRALAGLCMFLSISLLSFAIFIVRVLNEATLLNRDRNVDCGLYLRGTSAGVPCDDNDSFPLGVPASVVAAPPLHPIEKQRRLKERSTSKLFRRRLFPGTANRRRPAFVSFCSESGTRRSRSTRVCSGRPTNEVSACWMPSTMIAPVAPPRTWPSPKPCG